MFFIVYLLKTGRQCRAACLAIITLLTEAAGKGRLAAVIISFPSGWALFSPKMFRFSPPKVPAHFLTLKAGRFISLSTTTPLRLILESFRI